MAGSVAYMCLFYHRYYLLGLPFLLFDIAYYGPGGASMASCALLSAMAFL